MTIVGYARTSTADQVAGLDAQIADLKAAGCERVYAEHVSSVADHRPQLDACLSWLREGDTLMVTKPDRLARSVTTGLALIEQLGRRDVGVRILSMDLDTGAPTGKLMLTILMGVAAWEREVMLERQLAGIAAAKAAGRYKGRKPTARLQADAILAFADPDKPDALLKDDGSPDCQAIADRLGLHRSSVWRVLKARAPAHTEPRP